MTRFSFKSSLISIENNRHRGAKQELLSLPSSVISDSSGISRGTVITGTIAAVVTIQSAGSAASSRSRGLMAI